VGDSHVKQVLKLVIVLLAVDSVQRHSASDVRFVCFGRSDAPTPEDSDSLMCLFCWLDVIQNVEETE